MEKEPIKAENRLEQLKEAIRNAPQSIEEEFSRTANPWLSCFGSSVFQVELYLGSPKTKALLSADQYTRADKRVEELKERLYELKKQYPYRKDIPPENIKQELLSKLNVLREES